MNKNVLGFGVATVDYLTIIDEYPEPNSKIRCEKLEIHGGGNAANTMVTLSRLGTSTSLITQLGDDQIGNQIIQSLKDEGVSTEYINISGSISPISVILIDKKAQTRTIIHRAGLADSDNFNPNEKSLTNIDLVYFDGRFTQSAIDFAKKAKELGITIVVEAERLRNDLDKLFPFADIIFTSEHFPNDYYNSIDTEVNMSKLLDFGAKVVLTSKGAQGSIAKTRLETFVVPAYKAEVIDTTGAGDAYIGGFIYGYLEEWPLVKAMNFASIVASKKCEGLGSRNTLPNLSEAMNLL